MSIYNVTFDLVSVFSGGVPQLTSLYGNLDISIDYAYASATSVSFDIDTDAQPFDTTLLRFFFDGANGLSGDTIQVTNLKIDGNTVGGGGTTIDYGDAFDIDVGYILTDTQFSPPDLDAVVNAVVTGTAGNDYLEGTPDADTINGLGGNDRINGGADVDTINGGDGDDRIIGGTGNDFLNGDNNNDTIYGGDGADTITGGEGNDALYGNAGNNTISGGNGNDRIDGGINNDILNGDGGADRIYGGAGTDTINGGDGNDRLGGNDGVDTIHGNNDNDDIRGGNGNDFLYGDAGDDNIDGQGDDDTIEGGAGSDTISGDRGNDNIDGGTENDFINGGQGADTINGGTGDDIIYGGGIQAYDQYNIRDASAFGATGVWFNEQTQSFYRFVNANVNFATAEAAAGAATLNGVGGHLVNITSQVENDYVDLIISDRSWTGAQDINQDGTWEWTGGTEAGSSFSNVSGTSINNGYENWAGGQPQNNAEYHGVIETNGTWHDWPGTSGQSYVIEWDADDVMADNSIDTLNGGDGNDQLYGGGGNDIINGDGDNDILYGGGGNDTIDGGIGNDVIYGDDGPAVISTSTQGWSYQYYNLSTSPNSLTQAGFSLNANRDNILDSTTSGITSDTNPAVFDTGNNYALKFETTLTITTAGTYTFRTASDDGSELFLDGTEIVSNDGLHGTRTVTSAGQALAAGTYTLEATFFEKTGGNTMTITMAGTDTGGGYINLASYAGANVVTYSGAGTGGNDLISGGAGTDVLYGGGGSDTFIFEAASAFAQTDTIMDFSTTDNDKLDISDIITGTFSGNIKDYLQFTSDGATGDTLVQVDSNGTTGGTSFQTIARIDGIVGIDEVALYNAGDIIV